MVLVFLTVVTDKWFKLFFFKFMIVKCQPNSCVAFVNHWSLPCPFKQWAKVKKYLINMCTDIIGPILKPYNNNIYSLWLKNNQGELKIYKTCFTAKPCVITAKPYSQFGEKGYSHSIILFKSQSWCMKALNNLKKWSLYSVITFNRCLRVSCFPSILPTHIKKNIIFQPKKYFFSRVGAPWF